MAYRYRYNGGTTRGAIKRFDRLIKRLGKIHTVRGYRYIGRYRADHEAVLLKGENGSARLGGLLWGYGGEGPRGTYDLLQRLGLSEDEARKIAFETPRQNKVGTDWEIKLAA